MSSAAELFAANIKAIEPATDIRIGPLRDQVIDPGGAVIEAAVEKAEAAARMMSARFAASATPIQALAFAENYGVGRGLGAGSQGTLTFYRTTAPVSGRLYTVSAGATALRRSDDAAYQTTDTVVMDGNSASAYFNSDRGWYEIDAPGVAVSVGPEFDTAAGLINKTGSSVLGFEGVYNKTDFEGGTLAETSEATVLKTQTAMLGVGSGTHGGIIRSVIDYDDSSIKAVSVVFFTEWPLMRRRSDRAALDIHIIGVKSEERTETFTATAGQTDFVLSRQPVLSVVSVRKNNGAMGYTFVQDTDPQLKGSTRGADTVQLEPTVADDTIEIRYTYNGLLWHLQQDLFGTLTDSGEGLRTRLFKTDILVRGPVLVPIQVKVRLRFQSPSDAEAGLVDAETEIRSYCTPSAFPGRLLNKVLRDNILDLVPGVLTAQVLLFRRKSGASLEVANIEFSKIEQPVFSLAADVEILV